MKPSYHPLATFLLIGCVVLFFILSSPSLLGQEKDKMRQQVFGELEQLKSKAEAEEAALLSPANYAKGNEFYQKAQQKYDKGEKLKKIQEDMAQARSYYQSALEKTKIAKIALEQAIAWRQLVLQNQFHAFAPQKYAEAEETFRDMVATAERGDLNAAKRDLPRLESQYKKVAMEAFENGAIKAAQNTLEMRKGRISRPLQQKIADDLSSIKYWMRDDANRNLGLSEFVARVDERLRAVVEPLYPPFYRNKPDTLLIGSYTLYVTAYDNAGAYDFACDVITGLNGRAKFSLHCGGLTLPYPMGTKLISQVFRIVQSVSMPEKEISLQEAKLINPGAKLGGQITLEIPAKSLKKSDIIEAKQIAIDRLKPKPRLGVGEYLVKFTDVTIEPAGRNTIGRIIAGDVFFPVSPPGTTMEVPVDGFTMLIDSLHITPVQAKARVRLGMPNSLIAESGCKPATLNLGMIILSPDCELYREEAEATFGPWIIDQTGMVFGGKGYIVDLSSSQSPPGLGLSPGWKGVVLKTGETISQPTASVTANDGYLGADYRFNNAQVTLTGLKASFDLHSSYKFTTLSPYGYNLSFSAGSILVDSSRVQSGELRNGTIDLPEKAARAAGGALLSATFTKLDVHRDLDVAGAVLMNREFQWGEFTHGSSTLAVFSAQPNTAMTGYAVFYLSGSARDHFVPKSDSDFEVFWGMDAIAKLEERQITGLTIVNLAEFKILTPDIPGTAPKSIAFRETADISLQKSWLNFDAVGVNGRVVVQIKEKADSLGNRANIYYKGRRAFDATFQCERDRQTEKSRYSCFYFLFANSAVYDSELNGILKLPYPTDAQIPFKDLEITSTAHLVGGDIDLSGGDITLSYWGVQVSGSSSAPAGVLSVKTGQIIFTNAGIKEPRHFAQPFKLFWGEMLANGNLGELIFDYNSANQKFDGFLFTPSYVALSPYKSSVKGFLQVCGTNHFDYFGAYYLSIQDSTYSGSDPLGVYSGRSVGVIKSAVSGCKASNLHIVKDWGGQLADMDFNLEYDKNDQDGFIGEGKVKLPGHFNKDLMASVQINSKETAISLASRVSTHSMLAGVDIGNAAEVWGCVNIEGHTLSCMTLGYTLETTEQSSFGFWGGTGSMVEVKLVIKPTFTSFSAGGRMYVSMGIAGGKASLDGIILLTADFANSIVTGDMQGSFDFGHLFGGLKAAGHVNWYLSPTTQYFQGRAEIEVYGRTMGGGASGGIFLGMNVPVSQAWVLTDPGNRYSVNLTGLSTISGIYGYGSVSFSFNFGIFSGGIGIYAGVGAFLTPLPGCESAAAAGVVMPFPFVLANMGVSLDGEILWGLVSASAWVNLQFAFGSYNYFEGTAGLEGCVLWVICASVDVTVRLDQTGFHIY